MAGKKTSFDFIPLDFDTIDIDSKCYIRMFGRTSEGRRCCVLDTTDSYFWVIPKSGADLKKFSEKISKISLEHASRTARVEKVLVKSKNFLGRPIEALQIFVSNPKDISAIKDIVKSP